MSITKITVKAPGRINIIGEHTDYNEGFVLPAAIDKGITFRLVKNNSPGKVNITAKDVNETWSFDLERFDAIAPGWQNYVMGVVLELQNAGAYFTGFEGAFEGDIPIGSGMSSSAALECSLATGLNGLFHLEKNEWQLIKACQKAENDFVGMKCGIMDQFASMMGKKGNAMLLDCRSLEFKYCPIELGDYELLLLNSNILHNLTDSAYNNRREECEEGVKIIRKKFPKVETLRDVTMDMLHATRNKLSGNIFGRCFHVVKENQRVLEAVKVLAENDLVTLGDLMYQSHFSLQNHYEVSCEEMDYLVQVTLARKEVLGSRMMGGGFGGCTINLVESSFTDQFIEQISKLYRQKFGFDLTPYKVSIADGARII
ncbi:MAG: galactokinase [Bacteroidota bacterium]